ncbi:MAG: sigma 54-interacting transcriptional regulator [Desulfuromonadales bacterium]|nr:sigma 54-interacting transcriptional regulator [Desulfuromonadales bacterium]
MAPGDYRLVNQPEVNVDHIKHQDAFNQTQSNVVGDGVLSLDNQGMVLLSDRVIRQNLDLHPGDLLPEHFPQLWEQVEETLRDMATRSEISVQKEGQSFSVTASPIFAGSRLIGAICVFSEITELAVIARKMYDFRKLSKELEVIINSCHEGLWVHDGQGNVLRLNKAAERINNISAEEVIGRNIHDLIKSRFIERSASIEVLEKKESVHFLTTTKEGRKLLKTGTPIFDDDGEVVKVVVSERDITEMDEMQRRLEEQSAISHRFQHQILEMQQAELAATKIIAKSPSMIRALHQAIKVSEAESSVLILGESGVGKGLFADLIHMRSSRADKPLIKINCGAIPETLIESELFGHEKGAFTGAQSAKPGHIELADGGILFLDEIAELPLASQVKLLRFLEDGKVTRLGGTKAKQVDVRIIAATHGDLEEMVERKQFRLDLYYRLNVIPLRIPSLKDRKDCIVSLIQHYVDRHSQRHGISKRITSAAMDVLLAYDWPGNVRQLMNVCERIMVMSDGDVIDIQDLPQNIAGNSAQGGLPTERLTLQQALESVERSLLLESMEEHGNQYKVAAALGINQSTVARKLKRYGLI